jgi:hypothetical protein
LLSIFVFVVVAWDAIDVLMVCWGRNDVADFRFHYGS